LEGVFDFQMVLFKASSATMFLSFDSSILYGLVKPFAYGVAMVYISPLSPYITISAVDRIPNLGLSVILDEAVYH
jgi:hypothetical protein